MAKYVTDQNDGDEPNYDVEVMIVVAKNPENYQTLQTRSPFGSQQNLAGAGQHSRFESSTYLLCSTFRHARHCRCHCCAPNHNCSHVFIFSGSGTVQGTLNGALKRESLGCIWGRYMHLEWQLASYIDWQCLNIDRSIYSCELFQGSSNQLGLSHLTVGRILFSEGKLSDYKTMRMLSSAALDEKSDMTEGRVVACRILEWGWVGLWCGGSKHFLSRNNDGDFGGKGWHHAITFHHKVTLPSHHNLSTSSSTLHLKDTVCDLRAH